MDEQTKLKLAGAYARRICTALYGRKPELSDTRYKEMKDVNANSVYDREIAAYYNRINGWNDFEQAQILCQLIDEAEKIISSNLPVSQSFRTMITVGQSIAEGVGFMYCLISAQKFNSSTVAECGYVRPTLCNAMLAVVFYVARVI